MANKCYNRIKIGATSEIIQMLLDSEFIFDKLRPVPQLYISEESSAKWCSENWGTNSDRFNYNIIKNGSLGLHIEFYTLWCPPLELLNYLIEKYKIWVKCSWIEDSGLAGTYVGHHNGERSIIREFVWDDWSIKEEEERMS